jgi:hypothetical protein
MKMNRKFLIALAALVILGAAAGCNKNKQAEGQTSAGTSGTAVGNESYDYSKILKGDLSEFADAVWVNGKDREREIPKQEGDTMLVGFKLNEDGSYEWGISFDGGSRRMQLFPPGVEIKGYKTDTKKVRLYYIFYNIETGEIYPPSDDSVYYLKTSGTAASVDDGPVFGTFPQDTGPAMPVIWYAETNLRLRSEPDTSKDNRIAGVPQGSKVELLETGKIETIDNIKDSWFKVKTEDGTEGWLFSGYLTPNPPASGSYDYAKILNKDFSDFAGNWKNGNGDRQELKNNGIFGVNGIEIFPPKRESNGAYSWIVGSGQDGWHMKLYPVGTAVPGVQSDTTKVRLTMVFTPDGTASQAEIYYKD